MGFLYKLTTLVKLQLKLLLRDRSSLFWTFVFPIILLLVFKLAFGGIVIGSSVTILNKPIPIAVLNLDKGPEGNELIGFLAKYTYPNTSRKVYVIEVVHSLRKLRSLVLEGKAYIGIVIPPNFTKSIGEVGKWVALQACSLLASRYVSEESKAPLITSLSTNPTVIRIEVLGLPTSIEYGVAIGNLWSAYTTFIEEAIYSEAMHQAAIIAKKYGINASRELLSKEVSSILSLINTIDIKEVSTASEGVRRITMYDLLVPSAMVYNATILAIPMTFFILSQMEGARYIRLRYIGITYKDLAFSTTIASILYGVPLALAILGVGLSLGVNFTLTPIKVIELFVCQLLSLFFSSTLSIFLTSLLPSDWASRIANIIIIPLAIALWLPLPNVTIASIHGLRIQIYDLIPWFASLRLCREILLSNNLLNTILVSLIITESLILLIISIISYRYIKPKLMVER